MAHSRSNLILALLLLNTACPAAGASVMRVVNADGSIDTQPPPSLTELASMFPEEESEVAQSLLMLADEGPKQDMLKIVDDAMAKIPTWFSDESANLKTASDAVHQCVANRDGGMRDSQTKEKVCSQTSKWHKSNRTEESEKFTTKEDWKERKAEAEAVMVKECTIFDDVKEEVRAAKAAWGGGNVESYLVNVCKEFGDLLPRYEDAKEKCTTAKRNYATVSAKYEAALSAWKVQVKAGNVIQTEMDVTCCEYALATKRTCDDYATCYKDKVAEYKQLQGELKEEEKKKWVEWRVFKRIQCLLPVLTGGFSEGVSATKIAECRAIVKHSTDHLKITDPGIPPEVPCHPEAAYPGTDAYYKAQIVPLPSNAKGQPVAECVGMIGGKEEAPPCHAKIDVVLALDESGSMRSYMDNFKAFAENMVDAMTLGGDRTRVAVVGFAEDATVHESWSTDASQIKAGIGKLNAGGYTSISGSIDEAIQEFDSHGRSDATKVIILLSDGEQTDHLGGKAAALAAAERAKANDITIFAWGFGAVSMETLKDIASEPSKAFFRDSVPDLIEHIDGLQSDVCGSAREASWEWKFGNNGCARCDAWCPHGSVDNINYGGRGIGFGRSCQNNDGTYPCGNEVAGDNGACHQCKCKKAPECEAKSTSTADAGYSDSYRGWYDVQGCGKCLDYCRWVGNSGSGGNPEAKLQHGSSWWSCRLAGDSSAYSGQSHFSSWSYNKCSGEGAAP